MEPCAPSNQPPLQRTTSVPNTLLDKYELGKLLGRGSFAKVYSASALADHQKLVAVKVIDKNRMDSQVMEPRIICEISAMRRLQHHPNILKIHEVLATKTKICLVMELAVGGELFAKVLQRGKLKETSARRLFQQLVSAINFCHQNGVAHRDIKPQNLLLDEHGNLKISDFGLSSLSEAKDSGLLHTFCGTPAFAAPEVMSRRGYDGSKADAWSCGVILFFLLAAKLPFDDSNIGVMCRKIRRREFQIPAGVSKPAKSVITQLLDPNPDTRMSIEALMKHSWFVKNYEPVHQRTTIFDTETKGCDRSVVNAFDIISMSSGLDLSGLFEGNEKRKGRRFTSRVKGERMVEKVREVGERLGYRVEEGKGWAIGLGKGGFVVVFEGLELAENLLVVEVKVVESGGCGILGLEEVCWGELKEGIEDVVLQWHSGDEM